MTTDELLEKLVLAMEQMIDAQDDMWEEEKYSNYRYRDKIKQEVFLPAKENLNICLQKQLRVLNPLRKTHSRVSQKPLVFMLQRTIYNISNGAVQGENNEDSY